MVAVPAPLYPQAVAHPTPRVVWTDDAGYALVAYDWQDAAGPTYGALVRAGHRWHALRAEEVWPLVVALAKTMDGPAHDAGMLLDVSPYDALDNLTDQ